MTSSSPTWEYGAPPVAAPVRRPARPLTTAELAADRLACAARSEAAAVDGRRAAVGPANSEYTRACAARAAEVATERAADYRAEAALFAAGEVPAGYRCAVCGTVDAFATAPDPARPDLSYVACGECGELWEDR